MQLGWNYAALFGHPEQCTGTQQPQEPRGKYGSNERWFKIIVCYRNEMMNQLTRKRDKSVSVKVLCTGVRIKFLYSEHQACLPCSEGHLLFMLLSFFFFVLPLPPSRFPWPWPLLHTAAPFNLPNAVMGQANQPPERHWDPAKHFQLWHMWAHLVKCHDNIKQSDIPASQSVSRHRI